MARAGRHQRMNETRVPSNRHSAFAHFVAGGDARTKIPNTYPLRDCTMQAMHAHVITSSWPRILVLAAQRSIE